jgi:hypothetical protein
VRTSVAYRDDIIISDSGQVIHTVANSYLAWEQFIFSIQICKFSSMNCEENLVVEDVAFLNVLLYYDWNILAL